MRFIANILVMGVLAGSAYAIQICVKRSERFEEMKKNGETISAWESMEVAINYNVHVHSHLVIACIYRPVHT